MNGSALTHVKWIGLTVLTLSAWLLAVPDAPAAELKGLNIPRLLGTDGKPVDVSAPKGGATALVFYSSECPISNAYSPTLNRLTEEFPTKSLKLVGVCVDPDLSNADVATHARDFGLKFPVARDRRGKAAAHLGATATPEAFLIDAEGRIRYQGRIDDQFADRQKRNANPKGAELHDAIAAVLGGREVATDYVKPVGCPIPKAAEEEGPVPTYSNQVARILQKNCQECHRRGQVGPFALETFEQARKRADDLASVVEDRRMPPWKAEAGVGPKFKHDRALSATDIATLASWAEAGAPQGDPAQLPPPAKFPDDWTLGTPDLVIELPEPYEVPASGEDIYRCFVLPTNLPKDVYISGIEYRPDNRAVVHHLLGYVDTTGEARKKDAADPGLGYSCFSGPGIEIHGDLGGWAPGNQASYLAEGIGRALPKGADVVLQIHYHPNGKTETDRSRIGLYFSRSPIRQILHWSAALKYDLKLPPNDSNIEAKASWPVPVDLEAWAVTPHMHLLGRDMRMSLTYPDGRKEDLINIPDWDFGWQYTYYFEKPLTLPKGTVLNVVAHYDNSDKNPHNPNHPPKLVTWGEATTDEMCIGFLAVTKKGQDLTQPGQTDDLRTIFQKQHEEFRRKFRDSKNAERAEKID